MQALPLMSAIGAAAASSAGAWEELDLAGYFTGPEFLAIVANLISSILIALFNAFTGQIFAGAAV